MDQEKSKKKSSSSLSALQYSDIAFRMIATIALGTWFGKWLDTKMGRTEPLFLPIVSLLSVLLAIYLVIQMVDNPKRK
jgi:F0F1-type ATP synthase assembly protein I